MEELNDKKKQRLDRLYNKYKYKNHENFIIAKSARKTIRCKCQHQSLKKC